MSGSVEELLRAYCAAIDARADPDGIAARFWIEDGALDNTALGSPLVQGRAALVENYVQMFAAMEMLAHRISDFRAIQSDESDAQAEATVTASGRPVGGETFGMTGTYRLEARRAAAGWKLSRLVFAPDA